MDMEVATTITFVCAGIGAVLLFLCCVLLCLLICNFCRKHGLLPSTMAAHNYRYDEVVPVDNRTRPSGESRQESKVLVERERITFCSVVSPITSRLSRKFGGKRPREDVVFTDEELDVSRKVRTRGKHAKFKRNRSKSDWNLTTEPRDCEALLLSFKTTAVAESQYFDALAPSADDEGDSDSSSWEDEKVEKLPLMKMEGRGRKRPVAVDDHQVKRRIRALKNLQLESKVIESKLFMELFEIESHFWTSFLKPLHEERSQIVHEMSNMEKNSSVAGISEFWLRSMLSSDTLKNIIHTHDIPMLKRLRDIKIVSPTGAAQTTTCPPQSGFRLEFHFDENEFFANKCLTKDYTLRFGFTDLERLKSFSTDPAFLTHYEGRPQVVGCKGCKINWRKGRNVTLRPVKKLDKETGRAVTKFAKRNSFFNFFTPPKVTNGLLGLPEDSSKLTLVEAHYETGLYLKETFLPKVILFFVNSFVDASTMFEKETGLHLTTAVDDDVTLPNDNPNGTAGVPVANSLRPHSLLMQTKGDLDCNGHNFASDNHKGGSHTMKPDSIVGRYRMSKSEGFDEFLKVLGVGIVNRKLATSVTPINVIEISDDGVYTIRTQTTLRTTEITFRLNEEFEEQTLDGRRARTSATREGNVLVLHQRGDAARGEKDTKMIRDFDGDILHMQLLVDSVVCKRRYERVAD